MNQTLFSIHYITSLKVRDVTKVSFEQHCLDCPEVQDENNFKHILNSSNWFSFFAKIKVSNSEKTL